MALTDTAKNLMLDALGDEAGFVSLHTADPGDDGQNEVSGGTPSYARKAVAWSSAASGALDNSGTPVLDVPTDTTVTHWGLWDAVTGGNMLASGSLSSSETFSAQGTYTFTDIDIALS